MLKAYKRQAGRTPGANLIHYKYVAEARTCLNRDERLHKMREANSRQYEWFTKHDATLWQTCESLERNLPKFRIHTNNNAETFCNMPLTAQGTERGLRSLTAGPRIKGVMNLMVKQAHVFREEARSLDIKAPRLIFTDSTLRCLREECTQGERLSSWDECGRFYPREAES